ncbi:hypothetical protein G6O69_29005 [Pseudenhygromyxa sp. WMMC2535]|uniref:hypothetical protein n=1 Tax=Pseudenhygromyxa sp. WMMC2535 TaxID=2712867 RepID=UPI00155687E6|nr:hypothetical protein [Pseudenhygromyxa sp. WMMC2535]NVB41905.1 hypothetical protein [Pseudenhygromyxa sp. WMMC2535]
MDSMRSSGLFSPRLSLVISSLLSVISLTACSPSTLGLGDGGDDNASDEADDESASGAEGESAGSSEEGTTDSGEGESAGDTESSDDGSDTADVEDTGEETESDTGTPACHDGELPVTIEFTDPKPNDDPCTTYDIQGKINSINGGHIEFVECQCGDLCMGPSDLEIDIVQPESGWTPDEVLEQNRCYRFKFETREIAEDTCRYSRLDVSYPMLGNKIVYSTGSTEGDTDKDSVVVAFADENHECSDDCGTWEFFDLDFDLYGQSENLAYGEQGTLSTSSAQYDLEYKIAAWPSWKLSSDADACADIEAGVLSWTAVLTDSN